MTRTERQSPLRLLRAAANFAGMIAITTLFNWSFFYPVHVLHKLNS